MPFDADRILTVTTALKQAQEQVKRLENELRQLIATGGAPVGMNLPDDLYSESSMPERIEKLLNNNRERSFAFQEVFREIDGGNEPYIRSLLSKMVKDRKIESRGWGKYGSLADMANPDTLKEKLRAVKP